MHQPDPPRMQRLFVCSFLPSEAIHAPGPAGGGGGARREAHNAHNAPSSAGPPQHAGCRPRPRTRHAHHNHQSQQPPPCSATRCAVRRGVSPAGPAPNAPSAPSRTARADLRRRHRPAPPPPPLPPDVPTAGGSPHRPHPGPSPGPRPAAACPDTQLQTGGDTKHGHSFLFLPPSHFVFSSLDMASLQHGSSGSNPCFAIRVGCRRRDCELFGASPCVGVGVSRWRVLLAGVFVLLLVCMVVFVFVFSRGAPLVLVSAFRPHCCFSTHKRPDVIVAIQMFVPA